MDLIDKENKIIYKNVENYCFATRVEDSCCDEDSFNLEVINNK